MDREANPPDVDQRAAEAVFARYAHRLILLAEQHLNQRVRTRVDGEDVVQSVFRTFFRRNQQGEFRLDNSSQLWRLLVTITVRKSRARARQHTAAVRDVRAELPQGGADELASLAADGATPGDAVALVELVDNLLRDLPSWYARLLDLRLQGVPVAGIAEELGVSRQTIYRGLELLQRRIEAQDAGTIEKSRNFL